MKFGATFFANFAATSPLAEGRELKFATYEAKDEWQKSPLAEGRELKFPTPAGLRIRLPSPLAEGRELKYLPIKRLFLLFRRPSRRGVN